MPKRVVFLSCVGSRDNAKGLSYCSKVCCMYVAKHAMLYKHKVHDGEAHVFYMDVRAGGKRYDEFVRRAIEQDGALYHRGRVSKISEENGKLLVRGVDTLAGEPLAIEADLVVLAAAMRPADGAKELAQKLSVGCDEYGFSQRIAPEAPPRGNDRRGRLPLRGVPGAKGHPRVGRPGLGRGGQGARHVQPRPPDARAGNRPQRRKLLRRLLDLPPRLPLHGDRAGGDPRPPGKLVRRSARVNPGLCMGCGTCVALCPSKSIDLDGFTEQQIYAMVESLGT